MSWEFAPNFDAAFRAALSTGRNLIYVCPPAWWTVMPLLAELPPATSPGTRNLVLIPDAVGLRECAAHLEMEEHLRPVHAATGLTRTGRLLGSAGIRTLVCTPTDLLRLLSRSAIDLGSVERIVLGWPELLTDHPELDALDTILGEGRETQRIVITIDPSANTEFLERHARRAPIATAAPPVQTTFGSARYAVTEFSRTSDSVNTALDILNPGTALIWDPTSTGIRFGSQRVSQQGVVVSADPEEVPCDLAIALGLPTQDVFVRLQDNSRNVLLMIRPFQVPFVRSLVATARPLRLPSETDRAHDRSHRLRQEIRGDIERQSLTDSYLAISSLFDEYDPATVAAALASRLSLPDAREGQPADVPTWIRIRVEAGKRHRIRTGDLVGALLNAVEIPKHRVGKVDVRDGYSLVEIRAEAADKAVKGLNGLVLRGNKLTARPDRH